MYQFSDSDSSDSEDGIRFKTDSTRNKVKTSDRERHRRSDDRRRRSRSRDRRRRRSRSRSRPRHHRRDKRRSHEKKSEEKRSQSNDVGRSKSNDRRRSKSNERRRSKSKSKSKSAEKRRSKSHEKGRSKSHETSNEKSQEKRLSYENHRRKRGEGCDKDREKQRKFRKSEDSPRCSEDNTVSPTSSSDALGPKLPPHLQGKATKGGLLKTDVEPVVPTTVLENLHLESSSTLDEVTSNNANVSQPQPTLEQNKSNLDLQKHDTNSIGPTLPPSLASDVNIGPVLPLNLQNTIEDPTSDDDSSIGPKLPQDSNVTLQDPIGPTLPLHLRKSIDTPSVSPTESQPKYIGPSLPLHLRKSSDASPTESQVEPTHVSNHDENSTELPGIAPLENSIVEDDDDDDDEDTYGPLPPDKQPMTQAHIALEERALKMKLDRLEPAGEEKVGREEWMLELPAVKAANLGLGPRQFRAKPGPDLSDRSSWTDTPQNKSKDKPAKSDIETLKKESELEALRKRDEEQEEMINSHKKKKRKKGEKERSLLEQHQEKLKKKKEKDEKDGAPVRRPFNRDIDLKVNQFDDAQKKAIYKKAALLDDRFSKGQSKYL